MATNDQPKPEVNKFDAAAQEAMKEFKVDWTAQQAAEWMAKWVPKAGIKRLAREFMKAYGLKWV